MRDVRNPYRSAGRSSLLASRPDPDASIAAVAAFAPTDLAPLSWYDPHLGAIDGYYQGPDYVYLPGLNTCYIETADAAALDITGDLEVEAKVALDSYASGGYQTLLEKAVTTSNNVSYALTVFTDGRVTLTLSANGSSRVDATTTVNLPSVGIVGLQPIWLKGTWRQSDGRVQIFYSTTDQSGYVQLGPDRTAVAASIFSGTGVLRVGEEPDGNSTTTGRIYRVIVRNGIAGTIVADFDASLIPNGYSAHADAYGRTWRLMRPGVTYGRGSDYVYLPGVAANYVSTPDAAALDITGDIDIIVKMSADAWVPAAQMGLVAKWAAAPNLSYMLSLPTSGVLRLNISSDGTASTSINSTVATGVTDGASKWVRVTYDADNGASNSETKFYTSDDGTNWTQLGTTVTGSVASIASTTANLNVGQWNNGSGLPLAGRIYRAIVKNGIGGTVVADFDASAVPAGVTSYTGAAGRPWTLNGAVSSQASLWLRDLTKSAIKYSEGAALGSTSAADSNDPKLLSVDSTGSYVYLPGSANNSISTPDASALDITGDLEIVCRVAADDWNPSSTGVLVAKWTTGSQQGYLLQTDPSGLKLYMSGNGSELVATGSSATVPFVDGTTGWVKVTWRASDGRTQYFTATDQTTEPSSWTQLGADRTIATTGSAIFANTSKLELGVHSNGASSPFAGRIYRAIVRSGIGGTVVADFDASKFASGSSTTYVDAVGSNGGTWTLNTSTAGRKASIVKFRGRLLLGTDDYCQLPLAATPNMGATSDFTLCLVNRIRATPASSGHHIGNGTNPTKGFHIENNGAGASIVACLRDGSTQQTDGSVNRTINLIEIETMLVSGSGSTLTAYLNNTPSGSPTALTIGDRTGAGAARIGVAPGTSLYTDMEFLGFVCFSRALSDAEIAQVVAYYGGGT